MSQKTELQSNNIDLQSILNTINTLPEAGSGNGENLEAVIAEQAALIEELSTTLDSKAAGGGMETCTVNGAVDYYWTANSELSLFDLFYVQNKTSTHTVVKGTFLLIPIESASFPVVVSPSNAVEFLETVTYSGAYHNWYKINDSISITVDD